MKEFSVIYAWLALIIVVVHSLVDEKNTVVVSDYAWFLLAFAGVFALLHAGDRR